GGEERGGRAPVGDAARAVHDRVGGGRVREGAARDVPGTVGRAAHVGRVHGGAAAVGEHRRAAGGERPAHRAADEARGARHRDPHAPTGPFSTGPFSTGPFFAGPFSAGPVFTRPTVTGLPRRPARAAGRGRACGPGRSGAARPGR